jgi:hypothetical protein
MRVIRMRAQGYGLGWMLRSTAEQMVIEAAVAAPILPDPMQMMIKRKGPAYSGGC